MTAHDLCRTIRAKIAEQEDIATSIAEAMHRCGMEYVADNGLRLADVVLGLDKLRDDLAEARRGV